MRLQPQAVVTVVLLAPVNHWLTAKERLVEPMACRKQVALLAAVALPVM
jgi:hypothetical protein